MGAQVSRTDFEWTEEETPHSSRRKEILEKHPQIKKLFGPDPNIKWIVCGLVAVQLAMLFLVVNLPWYLVIGLAYGFGGFINHWLMFAIHEISHSRAFGHAKPGANKILGVLANLPLGIPVFLSFRKYHKYHHMYLSDDTYDPDMPTYLEAKLFCTTAGKLIWIFLQPFFYGLRPFFVKPLPPTFGEFANIIIQLTFNVIVTYYFEAKGIVYLIAGTLLTMGLHPAAGHFIAEHYMFNVGCDTYSYYGSLNWISFNVGYHNEHHDFPAVPGSRLPLVRSIASEYYDNLPHHDSWIRVLYDFITDPSLGPYARMRRRHRQIQVESKNE